MNNRLTCALAFPKARPFPKSRSRVEISTVVLHQRLALFSHGPSGRTSLYQRYQTYHRCQPSLDCRAYLTAPVSMSTIAETLKDGKPFRSLNQSRSQIQSQSLSLKHTQKVRVLLLETLPRSPKLFLSRSSKIWSLARLSLHHNR